MAFCGNCGRKLNDEIKFCPQCGTKKATSLINEFTDKPNVNDNINVSQTPDTIPQNIQQSTPVKKNNVPLILIIITLIVIIAGLLIYKNDGNIGQIFQVNSGYKPITLTPEDFMDRNKITDSGFLEQLIIIDLLTQGGDYFLFLAATDYNDKKHLITKTSPWGIYYKKLDGDFDIIVDMEKFMEFFMSMGIN